jgi:hypothetical protein
MYIERGSVAIQTPTHWNLIGRNVTAQLPVLSPNNILRPHTTARKNLARVLKLLFHISFLSSFFLLALHNP